MWQNLRVPVLLLLAAAALAGCHDQRITAPARQDASLAQVLQAGEFEAPCQAARVVALRNATAEQVGAATVWNGPTMAYVRLTAPDGWELTEVRVTGARKPRQFPRTDGVVDPGRFRFGGLVSPPQSEVVIEALHLGNPYNALPREEVLLAAFVRLQPEGGGTLISAWAEGAPFTAGQHPMYFRDTVQSCETLGQIAFVSDRDVTEIAKNNTEIYLINADGSNQVNLTNHTATDDVPIWSPNGQRIAFASYRDGNFEIYVMNADGTNPVNLTNDSAYDWGPVWSADGRRIAFTSSRDGNQEIYVMDADGTHVQRLTNNKAFDYAPAWSPDGGQIAFLSDRDRDDGFEIYVMNADGTHVQRLTNDTAPSAGHAWSPDGTRIAFMRLHGPAHEIYVMNADGSDQVNLTDNVANDLGPVWSPDGTRIAFWSTRDGNDEIYVMDADGTNVRRLTNDVESDWGPVWSPDGRRIAFAKNHSNVNVEIYVMNADGSDQMNLTNNEAWDSRPAWRPEPRR